jgi:hypothetical protein
MKKTLLITGSLVAVYVLVRNRKLIADKAADIVNAATEKLELLKSKVGEDVSAFLADPSSGEARTRQGF